MKSALGVGVDIVNSSPGAQASSSKAVLAALRTLQDKIRRMEAERTDALRESAELRGQLHAAEVESEQLKRHDNSIAQKNLADARSAYDRLVSEKTELEIRIARMDDRNKEAQLTSEDLSIKIRQVEENNQTAAIRTKQLEAHHRHLE